MGQKIRRRSQCLLLLSLLSFHLGSEILARAASPAAADVVTLPRSVPDPFEPMNRMFWSFNRGLMRGLIKPTSRVYRLIVIKPARTGLSNLGRNLTYPGRVANHLFQARWTGARDESYRFLWNSTVGVGGLIDVATKRNIPKSDADFGQTFGHWGWKPRCYLMLPLFGPSNERDTIGLAADTLSNPLLYISPYDLEPDNPLTYLGPYTYLTYAIMYNDFSDNVGEFVRFSQAEMDAYSEVQYAWTFARSSRTPDLRLKGEQDRASLETLGSAAFKFQDPEFLNHGQTRSVQIPATGRRLEFTYWLHPGQAPVVYIVAGLGSHRLAQPCLAFAELLSRNGFSVVVISSPFNAEFMENASTAAMPAYLPVDGDDLHRALTAVDRRLTKLYPQRLGARALMGYSMGAFQSLFIAATEPTNRSALVHFDRYVALDTPVRLLHGMTKLDEFYRAPLAWPETERTDDIQNTFLKVATFSKATPDPQAVLPFNAIESRFLIGMTFRLILRDVIYSSQRRNNSGLLRHSLSDLRRQSVYEEIMQYSYIDYFEKFVVPYYQSRGLNSPVSETLAQAGDLRTYEVALRANPLVRVLVNANDFLLAPEDLAWLGETFAPERLTVFDHGGHLGNFTDPAVQRRILEALEELRASPSAAR